MTRWLVNGEPDALVAPTDRGLLYGDGLFETIAFHQGRSRLWSLHMARLIDGCRSLGLPPPDSDLLAAECHRLLGDGASAVIRIAVTRGSGGQAYFPPASPEATRILMRRELPPHLQSMRAFGLAMHTSSIQMNGGLNDGLTGISLGSLKHLNRLSQVMIAAECAAHSAAEALVVDSTGLIIEGLAGNIIVVRGNRLIAPGPHPAAVAGVGLEWLRRHPDSALEERPFAAAELAGDDALWVINSVRGPCPVCSLDGRALVRDGRIDEWQQRWREEVEE